MKLAANAQEAFIEIVQPTRRANGVVSDDGRVVLVGQAAHPLAVSAQ